MIPISHKAILANHGLNTRSVYCRAVRPMQGTYARTIKETQSRTQSPKRGWACESPAWLVLVRKHSVQYVTTPGHPCSSGQPCRRWLNVLMGGTVLPTRQACWTLTKSTLLPQGGKRCVRLHCKLSRWTVNALPTTEGQIAAQRGQGQGREDGSVHSPTALWQ